MQYVVQTIILGDEQIKPVRVHKSDDFIKNPSKSRKSVDVPFHIRKASQG